MIRETEKFVDFYWFEFLNLKASGKEFKEWLKQNYPQSHETMLNKLKFEKYAEEIINVVKRSQIKFKGIVIHYPKVIKRK